VTLDRGQVVRDQSVRPFDGDLDIVLREFEQRDAATTIAAMRLRGGRQIPINAAGRPMSDLDVDAGDR
jgi:hypothetical protein